MLYSLDSIDIQNKN